MYTWNAQTKKNTIIAFNLYIAFHSDSSGYIKIFANLSKKKVKQKYVNEATKNATTEKHSEGTKHSKFFEIDLLMHLLTHTQIYKCVHDNGDNNNNNYDDNEKNVDADKESE